MAVDVSKIPNNNKFDPVRQAILDLQGEISSGVAGVASINNVSGAVTLTGLSPITISSSASTSQITVGVSLSVTQNTASGTGTLTYNNGVFTYTPPDLSGFLTEEVNDLTAAVTWANVPDANITQSSVTQHQAAFSITESQISDLGNYLDLDNTGTQTVAGNIVIEGDLTTSGSITYINSTHLDIGDNIIKLNADITSTTAPTEDAGFYVNRGSSPDVSFLWDEQDDRFSTYASALATASLYIGSNQVINSSRQFLGSSTISSTVPYFTFSGDSNTGVGRATNNKVSLIAEGTKVLEASDTGVEITGTLDVSGSLTADGIVLTDEIITSADFSATDNRFKLTLTQADAGTIEASFDDVVLSESMAADYIPYVKVGGGDGDTTNAILNDSFLKINGSTLELDWGDTVGVYTARDIKMRKDGGGFGTYYEATYAADSVSFLHYASASDIDTAKVGATSTGRVRINDTYNLPAGDGTSGQVLSTNGSGDLSWVAAGGPTTSDLQDVTTNGATTSNAISIYNSDAAANPRLSLGRGSTERLKFSVEDRVATITHQQDESTGSHEMIFTIDSPAASKIFKWQQRLADGSSANQLMSLTSGELNTLNVTSTGYLQAYSYLYTRDNLLVLNSAGTGWNTWASRTSNGLYNLDVDSKIQFFNGQSGVPAAALSYNSNGFIYLKGGGGGVAIGNDDFGGAVYVNDNSTIALVAGSSTVADISAGSFGINNPLNVYNSATIHGSQVWSETTQGLTTGSIHIDPATGTDHAGGAITFGASDAAAGTNAQAGIYVRSDGAYGTKMYFSTTDSYATGSKTAMSIDQNGLVTINPRLDGAKSFKVYYDMDIYNTVNFTDASWNFKGSIRGNSSGDVIIRSGSAVETTFRSDGYLLAPTWIKIGSGAGIYSDTNSAHFYPNTYSNYGTWRIDGERGNYSGILVNDVSAMPHIMYDNSGNGGLYNQGNGVWSIYYNVSNDCVGIGNSNTVSGYKARVNGGLFADGNIYTESSIFAEDDVRVNSNSSGSYYLRIYKATGSDGGVLLYGGGALDWQIVNTDSRELDFYSYTKGADVFRIDGNGNIAMYNSQFREIASGCPAITLGSNNGSISGGLAFESNTTNRGYIYYESNYLKYQTQTSSIGHLFLTSGTSNAYLISGDGNHKMYGGIMDGSEQRMIMPDGARYSTQSSSVTGAIKISLPTARYGSNTMMTFKVVIYEYNTGHTYEFRISGYNYSDTNKTWYNESAINLTDDGKNLNVRFGQDGSRQCVWIGETSTTWSYPQVYVMDVTMGYSGRDLNSWAQGWEISFVTSFDTVSRNRATARIGRNSIIDSLTVNNTVGIGTSGFGSTDLSINSGSNYPIQINTTQRYAVGFQNTSTSEAGYYPWLAHEYASKTTGAYSSMIVHFNGIGDKFWFNRVGDFEADRDIINDGWYYNNSSSGMYWTPHGYGFRSANGAGVSYGNIATYNAGKGGWDGYSLHRSNMSWMGTTTDCGLYNADLGDWIVYYVESTRCTGIGTSTTSSSYKAYVGGSLYATGDIVAYSDRRVKENVINIDSALDKVKALQGVYYNRINDKDKVREIGFIAQDVHDAVPELASYAEDVDEWGVKYSQVTGLHNEAIKELAQQLDKKDEQIANLQAQIDELKKLILNK